MNLGTGKKRCMLICSWRGLQLGVQIMCKMCFIRSLFWSLVEGRRAVVAVNALGFRVECVATGCSFCVGLQGASLLGNLTVVCPATLA